MYKRVFAALRWIWNGEFAYAAIRRWRVFRSKHWKNPEHRARAHLGSFGISVHWLLRRGVPVEVIHGAIDEIAEGIKHGPTSQKVLDVLTKFFTEDWEEESE